MDLRFWWVEVVIFLKLGIGLSFRKQSMHLDGKKIKIKNVLTS